MPAARGTFSKNAHAILRPSSAKHVPCHSELQQQHEPKRNRQRPHWACVRGILTKTSHGHSNQRVMRKESPAGIPDGFVVKPNPSQIKNQETKVVSQRFVQMQTSRQV